MSIEIVGLNASNSERDAKRKREKSGDEPEAPNGAGGQENSSVPGLKFVAPPGQARVCRASAAGTPQEPASNRKHRAGSGKDPTLLQAKRDQKWKALRHRGDERTQSGK